MGWLGGSTTTTVATQVTRVIKDEAIPNAVRSGTIKAILNDDSIPDRVLEEMVSSVGIKANQMYDYAAQSYPWGLPQGASRQGSDVDPVAQSALEAIEGSPITMDYCHVGPPNLMHIAWMKLVAQYGYDTATNQLATLTAQKATPVYLFDMELLLPVVPFSDVDTSPLAALLQWGDPPRAGYTPWRPNAPALASLMQHHDPIVDQSVSSRTIRVTYAWGPSSTARLTLDTHEYADSSDYVHVRYTVRGVSKYWVYLIGSGGIPAIDAVYDGAYNQGSYFPIAYFRYDKHSDNSDKTSEAYKSTKKMVSYLGMDYDQVADGIDKNPDIDKVDQALLLMAVPANTKDPIERKYLFDFFDAQYNSPNSQAARTPDMLDFSQRGIEIKDKRSRIVIAHWGIVKKRVAGSIGAIGSHDSAMGTVSLPVRVNMDTNGGTDYAVQNGDFPTHVFRRQVNVGQYEELHVLYLMTWFYQYGEYRSGAYEDSAAVLIPIDRGLTQNYPANERETLYARSLYFVFNALIFTHVSWYLTDFFQFLLIVVAVVITILSWGSSWQSLAAAIAAGSAAAAEAAILAILEKLLLQLIEGYLFKLFAKVIGLENALIIAAIAFLAGKYIEIEGVVTAPWASDLLQMSTNLVKGVSAELQDKMKELQSDYSAFTEYAKQQEADLAKANDLLTQNNWLSPITVFGESPDDFFNRTVHSGNIGTVGISAISSYVDIALRLPKLQDTLGGT